MNARKRKKAARNNLMPFVCVSAFGDRTTISCAHSTGFGCIAQDRHERRVLGSPLRWWWDAAPEVLYAVMLQNQPPPLWMEDGARHHRRYLNRRKRR